MIDEIEIRLKHQNVKLLVLKNEGGNKGNDPSGYDDDDINDEDYEMMIFMIRLV